MAPDVTARAGRHAGASRRCLTPIPHADPSRRTLTPSESLVAVPTRSDATDRLPPGDLSIEVEVAGLCVRLRGFPVAERPFLPQHYPGFYHLSRGGPAQLVIDCVLDESGLDESGLLLPLPSAGDPPPVEVAETSPGRIETRGN